MAVDAGAVEAKPKRTRNAQEILAAVAVALIAFWAPSTDTGLILRVLSAAAALAALLVATIGLELFEDYRATNQTKKANPFEVKIQKVELPTAPPGGVAAAASKMDEYLDDLQVACRGLRACVSFTHTQRACLSFTLEQNMRISYTALAVRACVSFTRTQSRRIIYT